MKSKEIDFLLKKLYNVDHQLIFEQNVCSEIEFKINFWRDSCELATFQEKELLLNTTFEHHQITHKHLPLKIKIFYKIWRFLFSPLLAKPIENVHVLFLPLLSPSNKREGRILFDKYTYYTTICLYLIVWNARCDQSYKDRLLHAVGWGQGWLALKLLVWSGADVINKL